MKAFAIKKNNAYKCVQSNQIKINKLNIKLSISNGDDFSFVEIGNPYKSNCLYEVNNIILRLKRDTKLIISIGQGILKSSITKELEANIICDGEEDVSMEILSSSINKGELISILDNYSIILLPGGSIFLKTIKPINEIILDMEWIEEPF